MVTVTSFPFNAFADESRTLDRIDVTGSRIRFRDLLDAPAISITKRGDYPSQTITLVNDIILPLSQHIVWGQKLHLTQLYA